MPCFVEWLITDRVICTYYNGFISLEDLQDRDAKINCLLQETEDKVYHIGDMTRFGSTNVSAKDMVENSGFAASEKLALMVVVASKSLAQGVNAVAKEQLNHQYTFVETMEAAIALLCGLDSSLIFDMDSQEELKSSDFSAC